MKNKCSVKGCKNYSKIKGLCEYHYHKEYRESFLSGGIKGRPRKKGIYTESGNYVKGNHRESELDYDGASEVI